MTAEQRQEGPNVVINELEKERDRLENAVSHLQRSISELKEAIATEGDADRELKSAIEENIVVIAKYKARIARLQQEIDNIKAGCVDLGTQTAIATGNDGANKNGTRMDEDGMYL